MKQATRAYLAKVAEKLAKVPFHGALAGQASNLAPIVRRFPTWSDRSTNTSGRTSGSRTGMHTAQPTA